MNLQLGVVNLGTGAPIVINWILNGDPTPISGETYVWKDTSKWVDKNKWKD